MNRCGFSYSDVGKLSFLERQEFLSIYLEEVEETKKINENKQH